MAAKIPIRTVYTNSVATGLAEYQSGDFIDYGVGGTGLTALGSAGQVLKVNSGATLPENSKDAGGNPIAVTGTGAGTGGVTISKVPFFTRSGGLSTKNTDFEFNATVDNNKPFLDQSTFVLANGSGLTSDDTITMFQF